MFRLSLNRCDIFFIASTIVSISIVNAVYSQCNGYKKTTVSEFCVMASDRCSTSSGYCDGSEGAKEGSKNYPSCVRGASTDHCITQAVSCGTWYKCTATESGGCTEGDAVKEYYTKVDAKTGEIIKDQNGKPIQFSKDKPYQRQGAVEPGCPNAG